jgi:hypothetical protein
MSARFYAPGLGAFTQLDTVMGQAQNPLSMNRYLYAHANPWTYVDPDGHRCMSNNADLCDETMAIQHRDTPAGQRAAQRIRRGPQKDTGAGLRWISRRNGERAADARRTGSTVVRHTRAERLAAAISTPAGGSYNVGGGGNADFRVKRDFDPSQWQVAPMLPVAAAPFCPSMGEKTWCPSGADAVGGGSEMSARAAMREAVEEAGAFAARNGDELVVGSARAANTGDFVYRGLGATDDPAAGLVARNPDAANNISSHVGGARNTQWISTTRSPTIAAGDWNRGGYGVVRIDLSMVEGDVVDLTRGIPGLEPWYHMSRRAINAQEVVIRGRVPPGAIERL